MQRKDTVISRSHFPSTGSLCADLLVRVFFSLISIILTALFSHVCCSMASNFISLYELGTEAFHLT